MTAKSIPGVVGAVNFAGGLGGKAKRRPGHPCSAEGITRIATGSQASVAMIWLYAINDRYWGPRWPRRWHRAYVGAGGRAQSARFPPIGSDGHRPMSRGFRSWRPVVDRYLSQIGFSIAQANSALPALSYATVNDIRRVPVFSMRTKLKSYARFLRADVPRAFALSRLRAWTWRTGPNAVKIALQRCQLKSKTVCRLYAVDDKVVWSGHVDWPGDSSADRSRRWVPRPTWASSDAGSFR